VNSRVSTESNSNRFLLYDNIKGRILQEQVDYEVIADFISAKVRKIYKKTRFTTLASHFIE
jgi:hypothetical protein